MHLARRTERWALPLNPLTARAFGAVAAWRHGRAVHMPGVGVTATVHPRGMGAAWFGPGRAPAIVRWSRGGGLPEPLPDVLGIGIAIERSPGDRLDVLVASSAWPPVLRHLLRPAVRFDRARFTSLTPFAVEGRRLLQGARLVGSGPAVTMATMPESLRGRALELRVASLTGAWSTVALVELHGPTDPARIEALALSPWTSTWPFRPVGALNRLRDAAYVASERARSVDDPVVTHR
jgi:hypothetical protein